MNPFSLISQFVKGLFKDTEPHQIGLSFAFAFIIGIMPKSNLTAQILLISAFIFKTNIPLTFFMIFIFSMINPLIDKITDPVGFFILTRDLLKPLFTHLYNMPVIPWTDFNNTVVMGSIIIGAVTFYPLYKLGKRLGTIYNEKYREKIISSKIVKTLKISWIFGNIMENR